MLRVTNYVAKAGIREQIEMERLVSYLKHRNYKPIIRNMIMGMFNLGELNESEEDLTVRVIAHEDIEQVRYRFFPMMESGRIIGEIFFADDAVCVLNPFRENLLQASAIGYREHEKVLQEFCSNIENGIRDRFDGRRVRGMEFKWKEQGTLPSNIFFRRSRYSLVEEDTEEQAREFKFANPEYSSEDVAAANALVNSNARQFILNLARISKMRSKDAADFAEDQTLQSLFSLGLVSEEYLLTCRQDQHTICVAPSKDYLTKEPTASLRCNVCERTFPEENLQVIYTLTSDGKRLVDGSLWMYIWITELLKENGVGEENIKWNFEAGGEELDIVLEDFDSRVFFELKDREFGLGDAYPFVYRISRYEGNLGIITTMDKVSVDAKKFFEEEAQRREYPIQIQFLEGSENIREGITEILRELALKQARGLILPFSLRMGFDFWVIIEHWLETTVKTPLCNGK